MGKNTFVKAFVVFLFAFITQVSVGADTTKYSVANIWVPGQYTLNQDCFVSLIATVQKNVQSKEQTQVRFVWQADLSEISADGIQKMSLQATRIMLRIESSDSEIEFYDSSNGSLVKPFVKEIFQRFMDSKISVVFKNGDVQEVIFDSDIWNDLKPTNDEEKLFLEHFESLPSKSNLKQIFEPFNWVSNPKGASLNEEWKNEVQIEIPVVGNTPLEWNCRLNSIKKNGGSTTFAEVVGVGNLELAVSDKVSATVKSEIKASFDTSFGVPHELDSKTTVSAVRKGENESDAETKLAAMQRCTIRVAKR